MMARNDERRQLIADAGIRVLAQAGARGLTHRAIDVEAGLPLGTTSNYFPTRTALLQGMVTRMEQVLEPDPDVHARLLLLPESRDTFATYVRDIVTRLLEHHDITIALFEMRLEARRNPEIHGIVQTWQSDMFARDVAFTRSRGLPGSARDVAMFRFAIEGLVFDRLTTPIMNETPVEEVVDAFVRALLPDADAP